MKRVPHLFRLCRYNLGGDRLFQTAAPGSNAAASAVCGWRYQEQRGNRRTAQPETKAEIHAQLYTAKRMIHFLPLAFRPEKLTNLPGHMGHKIHHRQNEGFAPSSFFRETLKEPARIHRDVTCPAFERLGNSQY
jgi:hypothetical protein